MSWFRRKPRGRHALRAAVTSLPSAPVAAALPVAVPAAEAVGEPDLLTSIAQLIASGEAWNDPSAAGSGHAYDLPVAPAGAPHSRAAAIAAVSSVPDQSAALDDREATAQAPAVTVAVPVQAGPRVQLGFRDGTTAALDPDSEQALALAELSEMLNARD